MKQSNLFKKLRRRWSTTEGEGSRKKSDSTGRWRGWSDALLNMRELPDWDGFLPWDCTPAGELSELARLFGRMQKPFPTISRYLTDRFEAPPFEYSVLDAQSTNIRLLRFDLDTPYLPSGGSRCLLVELLLNCFPFDDCPDYHALSYVWGDPTAKVPISVNGKAFAVTENLMLILSHLRRKSFEGWIWIDAICIDQNNMSEKSSVVQQIPSIYEHAKLTLAWLGETAERIGSMDTTSLLGVARMKEIIDGIIGSPEAKQTYPEIENNFISTTDQIGPKQFRDLLWTNQDLVAHLMLRIAELLKGENKACVSQVEEVLYHPLWRRIWIVQEFAHSQETILVAGEHELKLRHFFYVWAVLYRSVLMDPEFGPHLLAPGIRGNIRSIAPLLLLPKDLGGYPKFRSLFELLRATGWFEASDSRDKIFALMGLAEDAPDLSIPTSYALTYESLCTTVSEALLRRHGMGMLSFNAGWTHDRAQSSTRLPSWCSDWRLGTSYTILTDRFAETEDFSACGIVDNIAAAGFDRKNGRILLEATVVDSIQDVQACDLLKLHEDTHLVPLQVWSQLRELSGGQTPPHLSSKSTYIEEALFCVPTAYQRPARDSSLSDSQDRVQEPSESYKILNSEFWNATNSPSEYPSHQPSQHMKSFVQETMNRADGRSVFATEENWLGLGPASTQAGDVLCIFRNARVPHIIRPLENASYLLIGEAYVHGIMYGEYFDENEDFDTREIILE
ncbi:heterokaryon incompatibility protein-domain-containing protein [Lophiotrema nucula]|uniref:Heterokaryon incompatibility protein-domain-containing protein n=1 Tax=Lophiotrema nucula TaxID=690887 RepID=A0A6A5YTU1_9PLEO|nr:heterokaryon incompatibility protein-domain-containing protein [Lophiotrema nucula]